MLEAVLERDTSGDHPTAMHVLRYFCELSEILLQDAAVLCLVHDRADHPMFSELKCFQCPEWEDYLQEMKEALEKEQSPLDASLESVLPGVHQWHRANDAAVRTVHRRIDTIAEAVKVGLKEGFEQITNTTAQNQQMQDKRLAIVFADIARGLLSGSVQSSPTGVDSPMVTQQEDNDTDMGVARRQTTNSSNSSSHNELGASDAPENKSFRIMSKILSLRDLWDAWFGIGSHPCNYGGVEGRNKKFGAKWRKHIPAAHYSRCCRTVKAIQHYAKENRLNKDDAITALEPIFKECSNSLYNFIEVMQEKGHLKKAAKRGKQAIAEAGARQ